MTRKEMDLSEDQPKIVKGKLKVVDAYFLTRLLSPKMSRFSVVGSCG